MTQDQILNLTDSKNKQIKEICEKIKEEVKYLPDVNSIRRLTNYINQINVLQVELELVKKILL